MQMNWRLGRIVATAGLFVLGFAGPSLSDPSKGKCAYSLADADENHFGSILEAFTAADRIVAKQSLQLMARGATSEHQPRLEWQGVPGQKTDVAYVLIHGLGESPHGIKGLRQIARQFGNVYAPVLRGSGVSEEHLRSSNYHHWLGDISKAIVFARTYLGDRVVGVGFSLGGTMLVVHQIGQTPTPATSVDGLLTINPVLKMNDAWIRAIEGTFKDYHFGDAINPDLAEQWHGISMGKQSAYAFPIPIEPLAELGLMNSRYMSMFLPENDGILQARLAKIKSKLGLMMSKRDNRMDVDFTQDLITRIRDSAHLDTVITDARTRSKHPDTDAHSAFVRDWPDATFEFEINGVSETLGMRAALYRLFEENHAQILQDDAVLQTVP